MVLPLAPALAMADPSQTAQEVSRDLGLQENLPDAAQAAAEETRDFSWHADLSFLTGDVVRIILFAAIAAGIIFALWTIRERLPVLGRRNLVAKDEAMRAAGDASVERMVVAQMEADDLARQGRIAEAMHALLLRSLIEVRKRLNVSFADSLTSREILKTLSLPEIGKTSLADIIGRVELVYFGDYRANEPDYAACRQSYEQLTRAMQVKLAEATS